MQIDNLLGKLTHNADKLGVLLGAVAGSESGLNDIWDSIKQAAQGNIHMPNWWIMQNWVNSPYFYQSVWTYLIGEVIDQLDPPVVGKYGGTIKKAAMGYAAGSAGVTLLWSMTHGNMGSNPTAGANVFSGNPQPQIGFSSSNLQTRSVLE